ncbi:MAG: hypothetical protein FWF77_03735, partial [Defluviitaleaceae bacterium]|nr:hypothetical protein [Defluviitaleaceae bacterium]
TSDGIFSFEEIPAGSTVSFNISVPCETIYQYPAWEIFAGSVDIPRFEPSPEFIMPDAPVVLMAHLL